MEKVFVEGSATALSTTAFVAASTAITVVPSTLPVMVAFDEGVTPPPPPPPPPQAVSDRARAKDNRISNRSAMSLAFISLTSSRNG
jgi:hypothetical protein